MDIHLEDLAKEVGYQLQTLRTLLDRAEFADIRPMRNKRMIYGITEKHIERIKELRDRRKIPARWWLKEGSTNV
jgi:hypothetical protein